MKKIACAFSRIKAKSKNQHTLYIPICALFLQIILVTLP